MKIEKMMIERKSDEDKIKNKDYEVIRCEGRARETIADWITVTLITAIWISSCTRTD
jgi:hypothetical protein